MKKILVVLFVFLGFNFISCQRVANKNSQQTQNLPNANTNKDKNTNKVGNNLINDPRSPNPSSELAVLMRDMWEYADTLKTIISSENTTNLPDYRPRFATISTAIPTDEKTKSAFFDAMASVMLKKLDNVYQNAAAQKEPQKEQSRQVEGFNLFVKSCLQCHQQQCPGPVSKISKLLIPQK